MEVSSGRQRLLKGEAMARRKTEELFFLLKGGTRW